MKKWETETSNPNQRSKPKIQQTKLSKGNTTNKDRLHTKLKQMYIKNVHHGPIKTRVRPGVPAGWASTASLETPAMIDMVNSGAEEGQGCLWKQVCTHLRHRCFVAVHQFVMASEKFLERWLQPFGDKALLEQLISENPGPVQKVIVQATSSWVTNKLWYVHSIRRCGRNVAAKERDVDNGKWEVIAFVKQLCKRSSSVVKFEMKTQVWSTSGFVCSILNLELF